MAFITFHLMRQHVKNYRRGLNPPHRLKSISMTTFTDAEIESLRAGGNEVSLLRDVVASSHYNIACCKQKCPML